MAKEPYTVCFNAGDPVEVRATCPQFAYLIAAAKRIESGENGEISYVTDEKGNRWDDIKIHITN